MYKNEQTVTLFPLGAVKQQDQSQLGQERLCDDQLDYKQANYALVNNICYLLMFLHNKFVIIQACVKL